MRADQRRGMRLRTIGNARRPCLGRIAAPVDALVQAPWAELDAPGQRSFGFPQIGHGSLFPTYAWENGAGLVEKLVAINAIKSIRDS